MGLALLTGAVALAAWLAHRGDPGPIEPTHSIVVLPFRNLSPDTATDRLILGVHAGLVDQLSRVRGLRVASRGASLEFRGSTRPEQEIARELNAKTVLTGTVRRAGERVRFSVTLGDTGREQPYWVEGYNDRLTPENLFEIQANVTRRVAATLDLRLGSRQSDELRRPPTNDLDALFLYYRGRDLWETRGPVAQDDSLRDRLLEEAVARDSTFAPAWGLLARSESWGIITGASSDTLPARRALDQVLALSPGSLDASSAAAYYHYALGDYAAALADLDEADRPLPNDAELLLTRGHLLQRLGRWQEAVAAMQHARRVDPRNPRLLLDLGLTYAALRRWDGAETELRRAITLAPGYDEALLALIEVRLTGRGDTLGARALLEAARPVVSPGHLALISTRLALLSSRDLRAARRAAERWPRGVYSLTYGTRLLQLALVARAAGETRAARAYADSLLREVEPEIARRARLGPADPLGLRALVELSAAAGHALRGDSTRALALLAPAAGRISPERDGYAGPELLRWVALTWMLLDRRAEAIAALQQAVTLPSRLNLEELRRDPVWDALRQEPGFRELVARR